MDYAATFIMSALPSCSSTWVRLQNRQSSFGHGKRCDLRINKDFGTVLATAVSISNLTICWKNFTATFNVYAAPWFTTI
jgi:hypothetical protein